MAKLTREKFIRSHGATCRSWIWSWSFVNEPKKFIIFGAWEDLAGPKESCILMEEWKLNIHGRKSSAYIESLEHLRLVEEEGFKLKTYRMKRSFPTSSNGDQVGPSKIVSFEPTLVDKKLKKRGSDWFAY